MREIQAAREEEERNSRQQDGDRSQGHPYRPEETTVGYSDPRDRFAPPPPERKSSYDVYGKNTSMSQVPPQPAGTPVDMGHPSRSTSASALRQPETNGGSAKKSVSFNANIVTEIHDTRYFGSTSSESSLNPQSSYMQTPPGGGFNHARSPAGYQTPPQGMTPTDSLPQGPILSSSQGPATYSQASSQAPTNYSQAPSQAPTNYSQAPPQGLGGYSQAPPPGPAGYSQAPPYGPTSYSQAPGNYSQGPSPGPTNYAQGAVSYTQAPSQGPANYSQAPSQRYNHPISQGYSQGQYQPQSQGLYSQAPGQYSTPNEDDPLPPPPNLSTYPRGSSSGSSSDAPTPFQRQFTGPNGPNTPLTSGSNDVFTPRTPDQYQPTSTFVSGDTPGVVGAQEVYRDPRDRIAAQRLIPGNDNGVAGERMSFRDKMKMFATEAGENTPSDKLKISRAQQRVEAQLKSP